MCDSIKVFGKQEYSRVLDNHGARGKKLSQTACERLLVDHGASYHQGKDGAYVYLHHGGFNPAASRTAQFEYDQVLDMFGGTRRSYIECVEHLKNLGFTYGQAKTAVLQVPAKEVTNWSSLSSAGDNAKFGVVERVKSSFVIQDSFL